MKQLLIYCTHNLIFNKRDIYAHSHSRMPIVRSVSCAVLHVKSKMPRRGSCPALMHTMPLVAPVAKPWAVVALHVRSELTGDGHLASVRLARAVAGHTLVARTTVKLQSVYSYEMQDPIPPLQDLPPVEGDPPLIFFKEKKNKLSIYTQPSRDKCTKHAGQGSGWRGTPQGYGW